MDSLVIEAYGPDATSSASPVRDSVWQSQWRLVTQLSGSHYSLPRGPIGRRYVSILTDEIKFLAQKLFSSERLIICDLASENRPYDIFNPNGVISIML